MRSNLQNIQRRLPVNMQRNGTPVLLTWAEWSGAVVIDPVTKVKSGGTKTVRTERVKGFVHTVQIATSQVQQFNEFEQGDMIIDFLPNVKLENRDGLTFTVNGQVWVAKKVGDELGKTWDATVQGKRLMQSVLLRKQT